MGYTEIRDELQTLVEDNLVAVTPTSVTIHDRVPETLFDASGWSVVVKQPRGSFSLKTTSQFEETQTWFIDCYSPNVMTSYRSDSEDRQLKYADRLVTVFTNKRSLDTTGVMGMHITDILLNEEDYPIGSNSNKYHIRVTVRIIYSRARAC